MVIHFEVLSCYCSGLSSNALVSQTEAGKHSPRTSSWTPCCANIHGPGRKSGHSPLVKFLGVFLHPPALSKMMALTDLSLPGWDGNIPSWKQLTGPHLPTVDFPIQHLGALIPITAFWLGDSLQPQAFRKQISELTSELGCHYCSCGPWHYLWWVNSPGSLQSCLDFSSR